MTAASRWTPIAAALAPAAPHRAIRAGVEKQARTWKWKCIRRSEKHASAGRYSATSNVIAARDGVVRIPTPALMRATACWCWRQCVLEERRIEAGLSNGIHRDDGGLAAATGRDSLEREA